MRRSAAHTRALLWILLLALLLRLSLFLAIAPHPDRFYSNDSNEYVELGINLGEGYDGQDGELFSQGLFRTPGYPVVIAGAFSVTGDAEWGVIILQTVVGVLTVWLTYVLAFRLMGPEAALWAALALAVDPISIILANYIQPEAIFTFLLVAGTLLWSKGLQQHSLVWGAGAGAVFGIAVLVRPIGLYLPALLIPATLLLHGGRWSRRLIFSILLLLPFAVPVAGWVARNASVTGVPVLSTADGHALLYFRAATTVSENEGVTFEEAVERVKASLRERVRTGMNPAEISQLERSLAFEILLGHPAATLKTFVEGAGLMMIGPGRAELLQLLGDPTPTEISGIVQILLIAAEVVIYGIILVAALAGCYLLLRARMYFAVFVPLGVILYFIVGTGLGTTGYSRYRVPIMPFIAVFAGYALAAWQRRRSKEQRAEGPGSPQA